MEKKCENYGIEEVSGERDICKKCIEETLKAGSKIGSFKGEYKKE